MAKKTKIYLGLIAVGLCALGVDRFFFGASEPSSTSAGEIKPSAHDDDESEEHVAHAKPAHRPRPALSKPDAPHKLSAPELPFPRNLETYNATAEMRDIFARMEPDAATAGADSSARHGPTKKGTQGDAIGREEFSATHHLDAIMVQESLKIAVMNGRWLRVGDTIDTCALIRIEGDSVVFKCHDGDTELSPSGKRRQAPD